MRVVGTLDDGTVAEDLRYVNAPDFISEVTVDAVELYTTVTDKGKPVNHLQASNFKVFEDGVHPEDRGLRVRQEPAALASASSIDTSASMLESLPEAAAGRPQVPRLLDRPEGPRLHRVLRQRAVPPLEADRTARTSSSARSSGLRAEGSTALYDAIVYGLYQFTGVKGKKALVILSDGKDTASKFDYDTLLEYVRKSGIAIYGIGLKISGTDLEVKYKLNKIAAGDGRPDLLRRLARRTSRASTARSTRTCAASTC